MHCNGDIGLSISGREKFHEHRINFLQLIVLLSKLSEIVSKIKASILFRSLAPQSLRSPLDLF